MIQEKLKPLIITIIVISAINLLGLVGMGFFVFQQFSKLENDNQTSSIGAKITSTQESLKALTAQVSSLKNNLNNGYSCIGSLSETITGKATLETGSTTSAAIKATGSTPVTLVCK